MKKKLLFIFLTAILASCGSSGGGNGGGGATTSPTPNPTISYDPGDPNFSKETKKEGIDGTGVIIGIIDSDFIDSNPEFYDDLGQSRLILDPTYTGNGDTHGNDVAVILGGKTNGVASNVTIYAIKSGIISPGGGTTELIPTRAMFDSLYAKGVRIYNQSWGETQSILNFTKEDYPLTDPLVQFYYDKATTDSLFIWSAGNGRDDNTEVEGGLPYFYPEMEKGWITVVGMNPDTGLYDQSYSRSNKCGVAKNWCITASGAATSYTAPIITGAVALVQQKYKWMNGDLLRQTILSTAFDAGEEGVDEVYGWGLVNIDKAVKGPALFDTRLALGSHVKVNFDSVTSVFENDISGDAGIIKDGTGTLVLSGNNTYTGTNIVNNGYLNISGKIISKVSVKASGTLSINGGFIANDVINDGGTIVSEKNGGTITGNYIASADSTIKNTAGSTININGKAVLANSKLVIIPPTDVDNLPIYISSSVNNSKVLSANGGIQDTFGSIESPVLLDSEIKYNGDNVELNLRRKNINSYVNEIFDNDATRDNSSQNLEKIFKVLDNTVENTEFKTQAARFQQVNVNSLAATLDSISGQIYASAQALTFQQANTINKDLSNRLANLNSLNNLNDNSFGLWFNGIGSIGKLHQSGYAKADTSLYGGQVGFDRSFGDKFILGIALNFSESKADFDRYAGESKSQSIGLSLYGRSNLINDSLYVSGRIGTSYISSDVERDIIVNNYTENLSINHDDYSISGYGEIGYKFKIINNFDIIPFVALSYDSVTRGSFSEDNSAFGLKADSTTYGQTSGLIGLRAETSVDWFNTNTTLQGYFTWQKTFNDEDLSFEASYVGLNSEKINIKGIGLPNNTVWTGIGAVTEINSNWAWYFNYDMQIEKSKIENNVFSIGAKVYLN